MVFVKRGVTAMIHFERPPVLPISQGGVLKQLYNAFVRHIDKMNIYAKDVDSQIKKLQDEIQSLKGEK